MLEADLVKLLHPNPGIVGLVGSDGSGKTHSIDNISIDLKPGKILNGTKYREWGWSDLIEIGNSFRPDTQQERDFYRLCAARFYAYASTLPSNNFPLLVDSEPISKWLMWEVILGNSISNGTNQILEELISVARGIIPARFIYVHRAGSIETQANTIWGFIKDRPSPSSSDPKSKEDVVAQLNANLDVIGVLNDWTQRGIVQLDELVT